MLATLPKLKPANSLARRALEDLANEGQLTPEGVLEAARDDSSSLHEYFEWDDSAAAEGFRLLQAGALIRQVRIEVVRSEPAAPVRLRVAPIASHVVEHKPAAPDFEAMRREAIAALEEVKSRYEHLESLSIVWSAIHEAKCGKSLPVMAQTESAPDAAALERRRQEQMAQILAAMGTDASRDWSVSELAQRTGILERKVLWLLNKMDMGGKVIRSARALYRAKRERTHETPEDL